MKTIADAYKALNGVLSNILDIDRSDKYLFFHCVGMRYTSRTEKHGQPLWCEYVGTFEEFNNYKGESMKTVIDWSKAPEDATHYWPAMDSFYKFSKHDNDFVWQNCEWQRCSSIDRFGGELTEKPSPVFTQEMSDNGELPQVGMVVMVKNKCDAHPKLKRAAIKYMGDLVVYNYMDCPERCDKNINLVFRPIDTRTDKQKAIDKAKLRWLSETMSIDELL